MPLFSPAARGSAARTACALALLAASSCVLLAACTRQPTPYRPLGPGGGYEEARLQERVYRVTFQGNPDTRPGAVLDMALLRCAELTQQAGLTHFALLSRSAEAKLDTAVRSLPDDSLWSGRHMLGGLSRYETVTYVRYHVVTVLVRLMTAEEAKGAGDAFDAADLIRRMAGYRAPGATP
jgi:hypothetical protein